MSDMGVRDRLVNWVDGWTVEGKRRSEEVHFLAFVVLDFPLFTAAAAAAAAWQRVNQ